MILPIVAYGNPILRKKCKEVTTQFNELDALIINMWETLYNSNGVGLAAQQINQNLRLFIVDSVQLVESAEGDEKEKFKNEHPIKQVFINAQVNYLRGELWKYNEGCLSLPKIRDDIERYEEVEITYYDEYFVQHTKTFNGTTARIILHEYDHIEGKLFIDYLNPVKRRLLKSRLDKITKGDIKVDYKMLFVK